MHDGSRRDPGSCVRPAISPACGARQGRSDEAFTALSAIYGQFTEGFGTPDLQDAAALLKSLAPNVRKRPSGNDRPLDTSAA